MPTERLSAATRARLTAEAKERAGALRRAALNAALDALAHAVTRAGFSLAAAWRGPRSPRQLEA